MAVTTRIDHVGLTVGDLKKSVDFFTGPLGWSVYGGNDAYPASYVTDGTAKITLWQAQTSKPRRFDRHKNIGLHHLALAVSDRKQLFAIFDRASEWPGVSVEFAPEPSGSGPKWHFMVTEPGGCRIEICFDPR